VQRLTRHVVDASTARTCQTHFENCPIEDAAIFNVVAVVNSDDEDCKGHGSIRLRPTVWSVANDDRRSKKSLARRRVCQTHRRITREAMLTNGATCKSKRLRLHAKVADSNGSTYRSSD
jgi:hypothetical protein